MNAGSPLHAAPSLAAADWLVDEDGKFDCRVTSLVPGGFDAYVRVLHPAPAEFVKPGEFRWATWRETADNHGKDLYPEVHWEDLVDRLPGDGEPGEPWPEIGSLPQHQRRRVADIAARHTSSDRYWLAWWNGYGYGPREARPLRRVRWSGCLPWRPNRRVGEMMARPLRQIGWFADRLKDRLLTPLVLRLPEGRVRYHGVSAAAHRSPSQPAYLPEGTPLFERPGRHYGLTYSCNPLAEATWEGRPIGISPQLWWPDDRSWIVATEIDLVSTYIACSERLADELMAADQIEAIRVEPGHSVCLDRSKWG